MIRSFRATAASELKASRKRRWISSISTLSAPTATSSSSTSLLYWSSFRQVTGASNFRYDHRSNHCIATKPYFLHQQPYGLSFFSTNSKSNPNKDETEKEEKHDTLPQPQPAVWEQLQSLPNMITISRLASTPLLCYWIVNEEFTLAIVGCLLAGISDVLDGYLAKNHGGSTVLGTYLDPIADKFFINSLAISLWYIEILPSPLILAWASKDFLLLGGTGWYLYQEQSTINLFSNSIRTKPLTVTPSTLGKANTGLQFATLAVGILTQVVPHDLLQPVVLQSLCWVTGASSIITTLSYARGGKGFKYKAEKTPNQNNSIGTDASTGTGTNDDTITKV